MRRIFTSSPRDPRYHMLSHLSAKFAQPSKMQQHEPRAALFLNRFTRTLSIMYATSGLQDIIGIPAEEMRGRSFYYCIAENCLPDAIKCLENAKGNDSIAYLRFWFRDPRVDDAPPPLNEDSDEEMTTESSVDNESGGIGLASQSSGSPQNNLPLTAGEVMDNMDIDDGMGRPKSDSKDSSGESTADTHSAIFGEPRTAESSASSLGPSPERRRSSSQRNNENAVELEAVISCTSDGLVVCLRKARPMIPNPTHRPSKPVYENGLFAAPWATEPMLPPIESRLGRGFNGTFAPSLGPQGAKHKHMSPTRAANGIDQSDFMNAIRDQAVFAWALTGINGSLAEFGQGKPLGESLPQDGLPVWASDPRTSTDGQRNSNGWHNGQEMLGAALRSPLENGYGRSSNHIFGDPGLDRNGSSGTRSASSGYGPGSNGMGTPYAGPR